MTLVLCGNAAGHMTEPGIVYRAKYPCTLKNENKKLPLYWQHNIKAWIAAMLFMQWSHKCCIPDVKTYLEKKVCLSKYS